MSRERELWAGRGPYEPERYLALLDERFRHKRSGRCVVIGGGPSVTPEAIRELRGVPLIVTNVAAFVEDLRGAREQTVAGVMLDHGLFRRRIRTIARELDYPFFVGETPDDSDAFVECLRELGVHRIVNRGRSPLGHSFLDFTTANNTGFAAIQLAVILGFTRVGLLGFDGIVPGSPLHFHQEYDRQDQGQGQYEEWCWLLDSVAPVFEASGIEVTNLSRVSALGAYEKRAPADWMREEFPGGQDTRERVVTLLPSASPPGRGSTGDPGPGVEDDGRWSGASTRARKATPTIEVLVEECARELEAQRSGHEGLRGGAFARVVGVQEQAGFIDRLCALELGASGVVALERLAAEERDVLLERLSRSFAISRYWLVGEHFCIVLREKRRSSVVALPAAGGSSAVFIGSEPRMCHAERVLKYSIRKHARQAVRTFTMSHADGPPWSEFQIGRPRGVRPVHGTHAAEDAWYTDFSNFRWAVPEKAGFEGRALYLDADVLVLGDVNELLEAPMCSPVQVLSPHELGVMKIDCRAFAGLEGWPSIRQMQENRWRFVDYVNWLNQRGMLGVLPPQWHCIDGVGFEEARTRLVHFSDMGCQPWRPYPDQIAYRPHPRPEVERLWFRYALECQVEGCGEESARGRESLSTARS